MKKKILAFLLISAILITIPSNIYAAGKRQAFSDVPSTYWAHTNINRLVEKGIVEGYPDGKFHPQDTLTIEQFIKMVVLGLELPVRERKDGESWSKPYLESAMAIVKMNPDKPGMVTNTDYFLDKDVKEEITRAEVAYIIQYVIRHQEQKEEIGVLAETKKRIKDLSQAPEELRDSIVLSYGYGVVTGFPMEPFVQTRRYQEQKRQPLRYD